MWTAEKVTKLMQNPIYAIEIDPALAEPHETIFSEAEWVEVNVKIMADIGPTKWLQGLLDVLKGGYVKGDEEDQADAGQIRAYLLDGLSRSDG